ncbi:MAG: zinc-dependent metalloprotease [Candidatus Riflebacteria bacterium]|nr:zinc-dependent metalloprotease [Candidatus Riflebacteria bacterium]
MTMRTPPALLTVVLAALLTQLVASPGLAASGAVSSTTLSKAFLEGVFYFSTVVEGGADADGRLAAISQLQRVKFVMEDRFLVVQLAEELYSHPSDGSVVSILARFPAQQQGDSLKVSWGDDPTPAVFVDEVRTAQGPQEVAFEASGPCDVHEYAVDEAAGVLTFVKKVSFVARATGSTSLLRLRYNFLKQRPTSYKPKSYKDPSEFRKFGYFTAGADALANESTGLLSEKEYLTRIDLEKPFVYEIHPSVPEACRKGVRDAIESWNDVFEERTGKRPLTARDGEWSHMPGDLRYHVIFFRTRGYNSSFSGAYGPPVSIAHTGEIVDADVVVDGVGLMEEYRKMKENEKKAEEKAAASPETPTGQPPKKKSAVQIRLGNLKLPMVQAEPDVFDRAEDESEPEEDAGLPADERFYYKVRGLLTHELGHNLGLRHNFSGSADLKQIPAGQLSTSIMEYVPFCKGFYVPGPYDKAAIGFGYDGKVDPAEMTRFFFNTDREDDSNPLCNTFDKGDPYAFYVAKADKVMQPIRLGKKPSVPVEKVGKVLDLPFWALSKFINNIRDERSEQSFNYLLDIVRFQFPGSEGKYTAVEHLSAAKAVAAWFLLNEQKFSKVELTRRQRRAVNEALAEAIVDRKNVLEKSRIRLASLLVEVNHVTALEALQKARDTVKARVAAGGLTDKVLEIEENVLLSLEKSIQKFMQR